MIAPVYIPSKGRADCCLTARVLRKIGVKFHLIVEQQDVEAYSRHGWGDCLLVLPMAFKESYEYCDGLGLSIPSGSGPARNFAFEHAKAAGYRWQWTIDDNITAFHYRTMGNGKTTAKCFKSDKANFLDVSCSFFDSFENVLMGGLEYGAFAFDDMQSLSFNKRIFSCNCLRTDMPFRWRGRYNEDVILSLDILKAGFCTILLKKFNCVKLATQKLKGGNTDTVYAHGTRSKSELVCRVHSDCVFPAVRTIKRGSREHHKIDYASIKSMGTPVRRPGYTLLKLGEFNG